MSTYYFIPSKLDGNVIDIVGNNTAAGTLLDAYPQKATGNANQLWEFVPDPAGSGYYFIKSQLDGSVIDVQGNSLAPGTALDAWPQKPTGNANQLWEFVPDPAGSGYSFIVSRLNGYVIDVSGASTAAGAQLDAYPLKVTGTDNQLWKVLGGSFPTSVPAAPAPSEGLGSNYNYLLNSNCNWLTGVSVTVDVFQDITGSDGFGFQLNAYSATSDYDAAQQYLIYLDPHSQPAQLYCMVDNWTVQGGQSQIINNIVPLATLPSHTLPAGYQLLISLANGVPPAAGSALDGYWGSDSSQHVNFIGTDGHVHELYIHPGASWVNNDLTVMSGNGVAPAVGSALDGYWGSDSSQHVNFVGTDGHLHELYIHPGASWVNNDLTVMSGNGVAPAVGSALDGYWGSDSSQHVNFIGIDGHVHELYIHPGAASWANNDLTQLSGNGVAPAMGSRLDGYWGTDSSQHVNFIGIDGDVHELYIHPGASWANNDLTQMSGGAGVTSATYTVLDNTGKTIGNQTMTLLSLSGVTSNDVAPIVAFQVDFVDYLNGGNTVLSSGAGTITYTASNPLTALSAPPACVDWNYITLETANSSYSVLPSNASTTLTQSFQTSAGRVTGVKPKFGTVLHTTSRRAPAAKT
jgi:hypothetical protein